MPHPREQLHDAHAIQHTGQQIADAEPTEPAGGAVPAGGVLLDIIAGDRARTRAVARALAVGAAVADSNVGHQ